MDRPADVEHVFASQKHRMMLSTGAITGVHRVATGQNRTVDFGPLGLAACEVVTPSPEFNPAAPAQHKSEARAR